MRVRNFGSLYGTWKVVAEGDVVLTSKSSTTVSGVCALLLFAHWAFEVVLVIASSYILTIVIYINFSLLRLLQ